MVKQAIVLLHGLGATGKSFSLATLFKLKNIRPNQRVILIATENNSLNGIEKGLKFHGIKLEKNQFFYSIIRPNTKKAFEAELNALKKFSMDSVSNTMTTHKDSNANKDKYTYFIDVVSGLTNIKAKDYVTKEDVTLGNIAGLGEEDILIIDGLSPIVHGIWGILQGDRLVNTISDYGVVQKQLNDFTYTLVNAIQCSLIILAHSDRLMDDIEKTEKIRVSLDCGIAMSGKYIGKFSDVIYANVSNAGKFVWTGRRMGVETAARNYPAKDGLEPDFSLYNFFREDGIE